MPPGVSSAVEKVHLVGGGLGENGCMYVYDWVPVLFTGTTTPIIGYIPILSAFGVKKKDHVALSSVWKDPSCW